MRIVTTALFLFLNVSLVFGQKQDTAKVNVRDTTTKVALPHVEVIFADKEVQKEGKTWVEKYGTMVLFLGTLLTLWANIWNTDKSNTTSSNNILKTIEANRANLEQQLKVSHENFEQQLRANQENIRHSARVNVSIKNRQEWINDFRDSMSQLLAKANNYAYLTKEGADIPKEFFEELLYYKHKCLLLLYPKVDSDSKMQEKIVDFILLVADKDFKWYAYHKFQNELVEMTQDFLYKEWSKVKDLYDAN